MTVGRKKGDVYRIQKSPTMHDRFSPKLPLDSHSLRKSIHLHSEAVNRCIVIAKRAGLVQLPGLELHFELTSGRKMSTVLLALLHCK